MQVAHGRVSGATAEGRSRKERGSASREEELTKALEAEHEKLQKEKELIDRNARHAAIASSSTSAPGMGEQGFDCPKKKTDVRFSHLAGI